MLLLGGCKYDTSLGTAKIIVTRDCGTSTIKCKNVEVLKDYSVMDALKDNFKIQAAYGGSFVNSIEGLKSTFGNSGQQGAKDWFYFVNGKAANIGAKDYKLNSGDSIIWDYHKWNNNIITTYCVGSYPQPFISNNAINEIVYTGDAKQDAEHLVKRLKQAGIKKLNITRYNGIILKKHAKTSIILGLTKELKDVNFIKEYEKNYNKTGMTIRILNNKIEYINNSNGWKSTSNSVGFIVPVGDSTGKLTWIIGATDKTKLMDVIKLFDNGGAKLKNKFAICIDNKSVVSIP